MRSRFGSLLSLFLFTFAELVALNWPRRGQRSQFAGASCSPKAFTSVRVQRASLQVCLMKRMYILLKWQRSKSALARLELQVTNAITRQKKEEVVITLKEKLDKSVVVFGVRFKGLSVS